MTKTCPETTYLIGVVVASNDELQAGIIQPAVWQRVFPNQPEFGPQFSVTTEKERNRESIERTKRLLSNLGLDIDEREGIFVARETYDNFQRRRVVVCAVVRSLAPLKKRYVPQVRVRFPVGNTPRTQEEIINALLSL